MATRKHVFPRLFLGAILGALWSVLPAAPFGSREETATCVVAGVVAGALLTYWFTSEEIRRPILTGTFSLPLGTALFGFMLVLVRAS